MAYQGHPQAYRGLDSCASPRFVWSAGTTHERLTPTNVAPVALTFPAGCTGVMLVSADAASVLTWIVVGTKDRGRFGGGEGPASAFLSIDPEAPPPVSLRAQAGTANVNALYFTR